ncbi:hypothetical protein MHBO_002354, partial [Bonamia ostreae]
FRHCEMRDFIKLKNEFELFNKTQANLSNSAKIHFSAVANNLGKYHFDKKEFEEAIVYYLKELKLSEELKETASKGMAQNRLALCYGQISKYSIAEKYLKKFSRTASIMQNPIFAYQSILNKGYLFFWRATREDINEFYVKKLLGKAKLCFENSLKMFQRVKVGMAHCFDDGKEYRSVTLKDLKDLKTVIFYSIGLVHFENEDFDSAIQFYKKALNIWRKNDMNTQFSYLLSGLGLAYKNNGNEDLAEQYLKMDNELNSRDNYLNDNANSLHNLANFYLDTRQFTLSRKISIKLLKWAKSKKDQNTIKSATNLFEKSENFINLSNFKIPSLKKQIESPNLSLKSKFSLFYKIGKCYRDLSNWEESIYFFERSCECTKFSKILKEKINFENLNDLENLIAFAEIQSEIVK